MRTQIGIVGAGPAGLMLSHLLHRAGVESVVVENRSRQYVQDRVRAGVLEQGTVDLMNATGVGEGLAREGLIHRGLELRFGRHGDRRGYRIDLFALTGGKAITIYGQNKVVEDLTDARLAAGGRIFFAAEDVSVHGLDSGMPSIRFRGDGEAVEVQCDFIAGCDGFHGVRVRTHLPVRMAGDARRGRAVLRGVDLLAPRTRVRAPQHALAGADAALPAGRARR